MPIFDVHIRSDTRSDDDFRNLEYFETTHVLTAAHAGGGFERASDLLAYFDRLKTAEVKRLKRCGLDAFVALGLTPDARPRRTHYEVWAELPDMLEPPVVAIGEIGAYEDCEDHWELFERQVKMAHRAGLAILATPPAGLKANMTYKMMNRIEKLGFAPGRAIMTHLDARLVETVVREGFVAGVSAGPYHMEPREAARAIAASIEVVGHADRVVLSSALRSGAADILGIPKTVAELEELGLESDVIESVSFSNALSALGLDAVD